MNAHAQDQSGTDPLQIVTNLTGDFTFEVYINAINALLFQNQCTVMKFSALSKGNLPTNITGLAI